MAQATTVANAAGQGGANTATVDPNFLSNLQDRLLGAAGAVTSDTTSIDSAFTDAISGLNSSNTSSKAGITADYTRQKNDATVAGNNAMTSRLEAQRGFATNTGIVQNIQDTTNTNLKDLDLREQQAISSGDADTASKISALKVQQLQFKQQAQQQAFTNLLSLANYSNSAQQTQLDVQKENFSERSQVASIGLQYGIPVKPGDTLESVISKAAPFASQEQQAKLGLLLAQTKQANAEAQKALEGSNFTLDNTTADAFASTYQGLLQQGNSDAANAFLSNILDKQGSKGFSMVQDAVAKSVAKQFDPDTLGKQFDVDFSNGTQIGDEVSAIANNPLATPDQKNKAISVAQDAWNRHIQKTGQITSNQVPGLAGQLIFGVLKSTQSTNIGDYNKALGKK